MDLRTDEMLFFRNLTKFDTDENKAIYSTSNGREVKDIFGYVGLRTAR